MLTWLANIALHTLAAVFTSGAGLWLARASGPAAGSTLDLWLRALPWIAALRLASFIPSGVSQGLWKYTSIWDLRNLLVTIAAGSVCVAAGVVLSPSLHGYPLLAIVYDAMLLTLILGGARLAIRLQHASGARLASRRILVFGAGDAGELIVRDMKRDGRYVPVAFVDDDLHKRGRRIHGVPVLGSRAELPAVIAKTHPDEVLVAMPSADPSVLRDVVRALEPFTLPIRTLPGLHVLIGSRVTVGQIQDLAIEDLLRRPPAGLDASVVRDAVSMRRVLVTGAGGSIGAELCRQIAAFAPATLVMMDRYENGLHGVACDLEGRASTHAIVGDITDAERLDAVFEFARPDMVFHAAAHKHVPLMELNPCEAIKNNVTGTRMVADAAIKYGVKTFVFISTDKAVRPVSIMGATKRVAERVVQQMATLGATRFVTVRFGNVLGSNGSVLPTFLQQIRTGGPVTVTHPDVSRYFMLIPEAVQLVLHAAALESNGNTCVLDLGEQIKVLDLARQLIRLAGFVPDEEIPIVFTGLRPGEKLREELIGDDERARPSAIPGIAWVDGPLPSDWNAFARELSALETLARAGDEHQAVAALRALVASGLPLTLSPTATSVSHPVSLLPS